MKTEFWNNPWALSISVSILLSLSYPPIDIAILQFPAFIFLIRILHLCDTWRKVFIYTYPAFVIWNLATTYWLIMATISGGIAAILANALLMVLPLLAIRALMKTGINHVLLAFFAACFWVSYEFLHHHWDLAWPWLTLGNGWANLTGVIQYISFTGYFAISFWVVFTAALTYYYLLYRNRYLHYAALTVFMAFPLFSILSFITWQPAESEPIEVAVIQPNIDSYVQYGGLSDGDELITLLADLTDSTITENTKLVVWPENALDDWVTRISPVTRMLGLHSSDWGIELITGSGSVHYYTRENRPELVRTDLGDVIFNIYNSAFHIRGMETPDLYQKGKLVPIVERFPFVNFFNKIDVFGWVNWGALMGYDIGLTANNFLIEETYKTPALICYDSVFPSWVREFTADGAHFITIITNDGWWGDTSGHSQHFAYARLRSIENRKWIVRSANNGISGIISPDGNVQIETEYWTRTGFTFNIYPDGSQTFYVRYGNWFGYLMLGGALGGFGFIFFSRKK
jgi:apolipoprotein N-acyltransferase